MEPNWLGLMLAHSEIHRSISDMTLGLARRMDKRKHAADWHGLAEREEQFQYEVSGELGTEPQETSITIPFAILFAGDPGNQRDSTLDRPHVRFGFEMLFGPGGVMPYHYVESWEYDDDFNYTGAIVVAGLHCPAFSITGASPPINTAVKGILHVAFQGFGALWDADGPFDAGGDQTLGSP